MNYSRRQLEAFGEPLGESVTRLKPGGRIYGGGGSAPAQQVVSSSELPEWARPFAQQALSQGQALTAKPYQTYGENRIAGFSPMQIQAQQAAAGLTPAGQIGTATGLAEAAGRYGQGINFAPGQFQNQFQAPGQYDPGRFRADTVRTGSFIQPGASEAYMSPYMQDVVNAQQQEARRASDITAQQQRAQAVGAGAYGGSRQALVEAERQRNLGTQLGQIQATGLQSAFQQAQQQFNAEQQQRLQAQLANQQARMQAQQLGEQSRQYGAGLGLQAAGLGAQYGQAAQQLGEQSRQFGAGLGLQGAQLAGQMAGQLGTLGNLQTQQAMDIAKLQSGFGGQEQALRQQGLTQAYQDFLTQQQYPYQQLGFMSDLIRGLPLGQASTRQVYEAAPSALQQLGSAGLGLYGLSKFMAKGGVTSEENVSDIADSLDDRSLQMAYQNARVRGDQEAVKALESELAERASLRSGMGAAFDSLPYSARDNIVRAAGGGIVAFAGGGKPKSAAEYLASAEDIDFGTPPDRAAREKTIQEEREYIQRMMGPSATAPYLEELKAERATAKERGGREAEGLAALAAAEGLVSDRRLGIGIGKALGAAGRTMAQAKKEQRDADRALRDSEMKLVMADQARSEGQFGKAYEFQNSAEKQRVEALKLKQDAALKAAQVQGGLEQARINAAAQRDAAARPTDLDKQTQRNYAALLETGAPANAQTMAKAAQQAASDLGRYPGDVRAGAGEMDRRLKAAEQIATAKLQDPAWREAKKNKDQEGMRIRENEMINELLGKQPGSSAAASTGGAPGTAAPAPAQAGTVPPAAIAKLAANPTAQNKAYFDQIFGAGAADRALKGK